jgi:hypothetical protein
MSEKRMLPLDVVKEAFYRTFSGAGELWFEYLGNEETRRLYVNSDWRSFLEHVEKVLRGEPFDPPDKEYLDK